MESFCKFFATCSKQTFRMSTLYTNTKIQMHKLDRRLEFSSVINEAEKVVGYPVSFLNMRVILNDEIANILSYTKKLIEMKHPLAQTFSNLVFQNEQKTFGLIVLLMSKVAGLSGNFPESEYDRGTDILHSQRVIAEVIEMIKTGHLMHASLSNIDASTKNVLEMNFGNKVALFYGDYLLGISNSELARLKNQRVQGIILSALRDLAEFEFFGLRDPQNNPIPSKPLPEQKDVKIPDEFGVEPLKFEDILGNMKAEWTLRNILSSGSLLAKCCQGSLILANHEFFVPKLAYIFGRNLALAWQASLEKVQIKEESFSLVSAPVMLHLQHDPSLYTEIEKGVSDQKKVNYDLIRKVVMSGPALDKTDQLKEEFSDAALNVLNNFSDSGSKTVLVNIIKAL
ncbi:all trans-polyprenyl-diphosphate synthase PDSS2-like [Zophobas morio]|uniref:all trans-polyprenyl-diphosphate synthase PDSS2-like n=1 Tax=Zophobas morio TaxID=2755281 RepID=UPI003083D6ED